MNDAWEPEPHACVFILAFKSTSICPMIRLHVSECSVAGSAPEQLMTAMVFQAGVEIRSAMALCTDLADYTASADKAYADAEPIVCRMDEWSFLDRWRKTWQ